MVTTESLPEYSIDPGADRRPYRKADTRWHRVRLAQTVHEGESAENNHESIGNSFRIRCQRPFKLRLLRHIGIRHRILVGTSLRNGSFSTTTTRRVRRSWNLSFTFSKGRPDSRNIATIKLFYTLAASDSLPPLDELFKESFQEQRTIMGKLIFFVSPTSCIPAFP